MKGKPALRSSPLKPLLTGSNDAVEVKLIFSDTQRTWYGDDYVANNYLL